MSLIGTHESAIKHTGAAARGYSQGKQIRETINRLRQLGIEPIACWLNKHTGDDMKALWYAVCGEQWDGVLPKMIAGVPMRVGLTGGKDYVIEYKDDDSARQARQESTFQVVDDPHAGLH